MNLAVKDIRHNLGRFILTAFGIGLLLMIVMAMAGIYRGLIVDATLLIERVGADIWVVQQGTRGPFAEVSRVPRAMVDRVAVVPGVRTAREFVYHTVQREFRGNPLRMAVFGLSWPSDNGAWLPLISGRPLRQPHNEMIADASLHLALGDDVQLGKETYTVVGLTRGMTTSAGDGLACFAVADALAIQFDTPSESVRLERQARQRRVGESDLGTTQPGLAERAAGASAALPVLAPPLLSAVIATLDPTADEADVLARFAQWGDASAYSREEQRQFMLKGTVEMSKKQLGLFTVLLTVISGIIMALILYTLTLEKLHSIALLKLIGAPNLYILRMILQQALMLGAIGYGFAFLLGQQLFPKFPRRVILMNSDLMVLAGVVLGISVLASVLAIWKALRVDANTVLLG